MPETQFKQIGDYIVLSKLGHGSMGHVYKVEKDGKFYALKILSKKFSHSEMMVARFKREIRQSLQLEHPNIIRCLDMGIHQKNYFYVMEYVEGYTLQQILKRKHSMHFTEALNCIAQITEALVYSSNLGLIHRDIKPENIMVDKNGCAKLFDLGLAKSLDTKAHLTSHGTVLGTPNYMSPEQAEGEENLDIRSDIYSLGATLYHLLTGKPPFEGSNPIVIIGNLLKKNPQSILELNPKIPSNVSDLAHQMLEKNREARPGIEELAQKMKELRANNLMNRESQIESSPDFRVDLIGKQFDYRSPLILTYREFSFCRYLVVHKILSQKKLLKLVHLSEKYWFSGSKLEIFDLLLQQNHIAPSEIIKHHKKWMEREIENTNLLFLEIAFRREVISKETYREVKSKLKEIGTKPITAYMTDNGWLNERTRAYVQGCVWQKRFKNFNTLFIKVAVEQKFITKAQSKKCLLMYENLIIMGSFRELSEIFIEKGYLETIHVRCILRALQWNQLFGNEVGALVKAQRIASTN